MSNLKLGVSRINYILAGAALGIALALSMVSTAILLSDTISRVREINDKVTLILGILSAAEITK